MQKNRLIPVVLMKNGVVVQSKSFKRYQRLGNPSTIVERLSDWAADELIYLDISRDSVYDLGRDDLNFSNPHSIIDILKEVAKRCFMPLTFGGRVKSVHDVFERISNGADKVSINSQAVLNPALITECAKEFGSQCIVVSVDVLEQEPNCWEVFIDGGKKATGLTPVEWAYQAQELGAGEIFLNSINRDGAGQGYDIPLIRAVAEKLSIPLIACGGVGEWEHLSEGLSQGQANAVAAANIFHYTENSVFEAKKYLYDNKINIRQPFFL